MDPDVPGPARWRRAVGVLVVAAFLLVVGDGIALIHVVHRPGRVEPVLAPGGSRGGSAPSTAATPAPTPPPTSATTSPTTGPPATYATPTDLPAHLLVPEDMGGYYRVDTPVAAVDLSGSACLSALAAPASPDARASTYFAVGNEGDLPAILEVVDAYPSSAETTVAFAADRVDLARCVDLTTTLDGGGILVTHLSPTVLAPIGARAVAYRGTFATAGLAQSIQIAVVQGPHELLLLVQLDRDPPVAGSAIYDNFPSAVVTAYGKLA